MENSKHPALSIVIVNKNERIIEATLSRLNKLKSPLPYEVIVIDASEGRLDDIRHRFESTRWYAFKPINGKRTIAAQRNLGIGKAAGDIVVFIDAGCAPSVQWIKRLLHPILFEAENITAGDTVSARTGVIHDQTKQLWSGKKYLDECPTINLAVKKSVFKSVGEFDEKIGFAEDVDFIWRAIDSGYEVRHAPNADITVDWGTRKNETERWIRYGIGRAKLYKKHPHRLKQLLRSDPMAIAYPGYIIGLPLTLIFWPYPLFILLPLITNVRHQPLKTVGYHLLYGIGVLRGLFL